MLDGQRYEIAAKRHTLSGYSAHADQADLIRFVDGMQSRPGQIRLVHGEEDAKSALATELSKRGYKVD
jgi:metallo-beta-lactamase family protein